MTTGTLKLELKAMWRQAIGGLLLIVPVSMGLILLLLFGCEDHSTSDPAPAPVTRDNAAPASCEATDRLPGVCPGRGLFDAATRVTLKPVQAGEALRYTLDGSEPTLDSGEAYGGPIQIQGTAERPAATLRVASFGAGGKRSRVATHSYIFAQHVIAQSPSPAGAPQTWGTTSSHQADYEMDPKVLGDATAKQRAVAGLRALPSLSLVTDPGHMFGPDGVYSNPHRGGNAGERPTSAELILPDSTPGFAVDCGLRAQGGTSTHAWKSLKVSLRLLFKKRYGPGKLRYPLFADSSVDAFDTLVLDAHLVSYNHPDGNYRRRALFVRDAHASDTQNALGSFAPHSRFMHLYLNGLYWGLYDVHERPDASFAASYLGGHKDDYDILRHNDGLVVDGTGDAWGKMMRTLRNARTSRAPMTDLETWLDMDSFVDYLLVNIYLGNRDWPMHNWYASRRRSPQGRFRFHSWDAEVTARAVNYDGTQLRGGPVAALYYELLRDARFRNRLINRARELMGDGGALSPQEAASRFTQRLDEVEPAVILESARWGDAVTGADPHGHGEWITERDNLLRHYFPKRSAVTLGHVHKLRHPPPRSRRGRNR